ncbi:MAG: serine/threonine protein phosphatase [Mesorhizobium sp.]|nr:serine/threonine protein phosphatase [Mesorhizobium sp.]
MAGTNDDSGDVLSPQATEKLIRLLAGSERYRLSSAQIDDRAVWIKRLDAERSPIAKRIHAWISPLIPFVSLRSSARGTASAMAQREARKAAAFRAAGFATPTILYQGDAVLVLSEVSEIAEHMLWRLRETDPEQYEELLVSMAAALGRVHAAGLCHGRPHPSDFFYQNESWGFLDFEEEPEAVMPLAAAHARDVWLLFLRISTFAMRQETVGRAFAAYRAEAPVATIPELRRVVSLFSILIPGLTMLKPFGLGRNGREILAMTRFMRAALREPEARTPARDIAKSVPKEPGYRDERP